MSRQRTATALLEASGAFKKHPERARKHEPKPAGSFPAEPPDHLTDAERECWIETVAIVPPGVLGNADVHLVEAYAVHLAQFRKLRERMPAAQMGRFHQLMRGLGLDPGGRAALVVEQPKENPYAGHPRAV